MLQSKNNEMQRVMVMAVLTIGLFFVSASFAAAQFGPTHATAVVWPNGKTFFFTGSEFISYDNATDRIDAAVSWPNGNTYFFRGADFISYDTKADRSDPGYPRSIASSWPAILRDGIDAATMYPGGKALFYKAGSYLSYDIATARVDPPK